MEAIRRIAEYVGLPDKDMLQCQLALSEEERKLDWLRVLKSRMFEKKLADE